MAVLGTAPMIPPPTHGSAWEQLVTGAVVVEMSTLHEGALEADVVDMNILHNGVNVTVCVDVSMGALEADVVDMNILHDGVNVTVCVDVSITVDTTGITSSVN